MIKVKAVIFDRDGVIINSEYAVVASVPKAFKALGFEVTEEDLKYIVGRSVTSYKDYFLNKWDFDFEEYRKLQKEFFYQGLESAPIFEKTVDLINSLHSKNIPIGLTTSAGKDTTDVVLKMANLEGKFNVIVTKEDCTKLKPDPEPYIVTAQKLNIDPKYCVAIEDSALGVESAKKAGLFCIAIPNEFSKEHDFSLADIVLDSAEEVERVLEFI